MKNYETVPTSSANDFPESNQAFMDPMGQMQMNMMGQQEPPVTTKKKEKKKVIRVAGGTVWEDSSLLDWDNSMFSYDTAYCMIYCQSLFQTIFVKKNIAT